MRRGLAFLASQSQSLSEELRESLFCPAKKPGDPFDPFDSSDRTQATMSLSDDDSETSFCSISHHDDVSSSSSSLLDANDCGEKHRRRSRSSKQKRLRFADETEVGRTRQPLVTEVWTRPRTHYREMRRLYYTEHQVERFRRDADVEELMESAMERLRASKGRLREDACRQGGSGYRRRI
ncbi:hypothetical protein THAOC_36283 [Thalassiosira oceanica]|uniref:Uncharacterized protein n=1 Tax=Thalassiosira oceanica TaxID=159749 RepID=K0RF02_THAOC|nr:hypothetical protein THAOC_36283 [Thalassiosira oceanica]|eukprot:EJK45122.1 hypothetical protein THAOC_36283 [Thalassiosira oceanica]